MKLFSAVRVKAGTLRWLAVLALAAVVAALIAIEAPVERLLSSVPKKGAFGELLETIEVFGSGFGALLAVAMVAVLDGRRGRPGRLALCALGAGFVANVIKVFMPRTRPYAADLLASDAGETFLGWVPILERGSAMQSFPSAHTATAAGLAFGLAAMYPNGRRLFASLVAGVAVQRMLVGAHFPSDVVMGAAVGGVWAWSCQPGRAVGRRYEACLGWARRRFWPEAIEGQPGADTILVLPATEAGDAEPGIKRAA